MIEKILLAVDESVHSERIVDVAAELASRLGSEAIVLHIREWIVGPGAPFDEGSTETQALVDRIVTQLGDLDVNARGLVTGGYFGHVPRLIVDVATSESVDLICVGSHGVSDLAEILLGSVAQKVVHLARVPVLVVR